MNYYIAILVKYKGPTDHKGSRVVLSLPRHGKKKIIPYDYALRGSPEIAAAFLERHDIRVEGEADAGEETILLVCHSERLMDLFGA
jgi:hypothetical protein